MGLSHGSCTVDECSTVGRLRRGMCNKHYEKARRNGAFTETICSIENCSGPGTYRGMCNRHYLRARNSSEGLLPLTREDQFWALVDKNGPVPDFAPELGPCWIWTGTTHDGTADSYGKVRYDNKIQFAHRVAWNILIGSIPPRVLLDHACHRPRCVNPAHLRPSTAAWNSQHRKGPNSNNTSGFRGVSWHPQAKKWWGKFKAEGKQYSCGLWGTPEEAAEAVQAKRREIHHWLAPDDRE